MASVRTLRINSGSDDARITTLLAYYKRRSDLGFNRWPGLGRSQLSLVAFYGYTFAYHFWLTLPLVPSLLLISVEHSSTPEYHPLGKTLSAVVCG